MNSIIYNFFIFFHSKFNLKKKLKNVIIECFVEKENEAPLFIIIKTGDKIELKSCLFFMDLLHVIFKIKLN
jgi:hypothetical protein